MEVVYIQITGVYIQITGVYTQMAGVYAQIAGVYTQIAGVYTQVAGVYTQIAEIHIQMAGVYTQNYLKDKFVCIFPDNGWWKPKQVWRIEKLYLSVQRICRESKERMQNKKKLGLE
jgi:hypothetical protein